MKKYKCIVSYDGTNYSGFQVQKNNITIQSALQDAFFKRFQQKIDVTGASRTDSGVHALGQVIHFETEEIQDFNFFLYQINSILPKDIKILSIEEVDSSFHCRYNSKKKTYFYYLTHQQHLPPFGREYLLTVPHKIDIESMKEASKAFIGSISATITCAPIPRAREASPRPHQPYPTTKNFLPAKSIFVARTTPSTVDCPVP